MAIYENTLRAETRTIGGVEIGRFSFAYKHSWMSGNVPGGSGRRVRAAESHAVEAQDRNAHVRHFIIADSFAEATQAGYWVFRIDRDPPMSCSELRDATVVGQLRKERGRFVLKRLGEG
jgi:hypothetical protein